MVQLLTLIVAAAVSVVQSTSGKIPDWSYNFSGTPLVISTIGAKIYNVKNVSDETITAYQLGCVAIDDSSHPRITYPMPVVTAELKPGESAGTYLFDHILEEKTTCDQKKSKLTVIFVKSGNREWHAIAEESSQQNDCVDRNPGGWPLPWVRMKFSISKRVPLLYNGKPTTLYRRKIIFPREVSLSVPGCGRASLLRTDFVTRVDYEGHVFAYVISGTAVRRDENGEEHALGAVKWAMWYDENGDGRFEKIIWSPQGPPVIPDGLRTGKGSSR